MCFFVDWERFDGRPGGVPVSGQKDVRREESTPWNIENAERGKILLMCKGVKTREINGLGIDKFVKFTE